MKHEQQNYIVKMSKLLANANRVLIVNLVASQSRHEKLTVTEIAEKTGLEVNLVSNQLVKLRENNILKASQSGTNMFYEVKDRRITQIVDQMKKLA